VFLVQGGVGGGHALFRCVLHHFSCYKWIIMFIIDTIRQSPKTTGVRARVSELFRVFGSGGVGGGHALFQCILHHFSRSKRPILYILDIIIRYQKTRGAGTRVLDLFTVFGLGGRRRACSVSVCYPPFLTV